MDEANELLDALVNGLWNDLTRHQKRSQPFRLTRVPMEPTAENLGNTDAFVSRSWTGSSKACSTGRRSSICRSERMTPSVISLSCAP